MDEHATSRAILDAYIQKIQPRYIIGLDEVGWGAIAGPVAVGCAVFETSYRNTKLKDSKKYTTEKARQRAAQIVSDAAAFVRVCSAQPGELEVFGAGPILQQLFLTAAESAISAYPDSVVVLDGKNTVKGLNHPQVCVPKADAVCTAVSGASIWAKVWRDNYMNDLHKDYVEFEWYANKGYPTLQHFTLLKKYGVSAQHRLNVSVVAEIQKTVGSYEEKKNREAEEAG